MSGKVYIVGAGPGDPELITIKGLNLIKIADALIYDRLVSKKLLEYCKSNCELIYVGKSPEKHEMEQEQINEMLVNKAMEGKIVVRLKGGDPYIFGRGEEECSYVIEKGIFCEVVPGIPSFIGAAAYSGIPLTNRNISSSFSVITGKEAKEKKFSNVKLEEIARASNTIVIMMGISTIRENLETIAKVKGDNEKCAIIMNATTDSQRVVTGTIKEILDNYENLHLENPAIIIVGKIVNMRDKLWKKD